MKIRQDRHSRSGHGLAGRLGAWSAEHRGKAALAWIVLLVLGLSLAAGGFHISERKLSRAEMQDGDSAKAQRLLDQADFTRRAAEEILLQTPGGSIRGSEPRQAVDDLVAAIDRTGRVQEIRSPFAPGNGGQISADGRSALVLFQMKGKAESADQRVAPVMDAVSRVGAAHPALRIDQFGEASTGKVLKDTIGKDFSRAETSSIPLTFVILWIVFAAIVAALLPMVLALTAIMIATGVVALTSHAVPIDTSAASMILLIGLAVGVDYSLFYVRRAREERARGLSSQESIAVAAATSGSAILTSGLTVIVAMSAMFITGQGIFMGMAEATAIVVAVAMLGSLTVVPAMLSKLGDRIDRGRIPWVGRRRSDGESRFWARIVHLSLRHPGRTALLTGGFLVALALPAIRIQTAVPGADDLPRNLAIMQTFQRIQQAFPGGPLPAQVVVSASDVRSPGVQNEVAALKREAVATGQMHEPITVDMNPRHTVLSVRVPLVGDGVDTSSTHALETLRKTVVPDTVGKVGTAYVTGPTASSVDFNRKLHDRQPYVFAFVLILAFLLLLWNFRSIVIPATAIVLNLLSVGAAYGVLVAVFQWGWGGSLIGLNHHGPISSWLPLFLFVILFGLSMDYHVFILSRIRELHDQGFTTSESISRGITRSAGVVTSAAIVMVAVFSTFATLSIVSSKQMGVGLAVAVLLDATVVRGLLLPSVMGLLGEWNWYLPPWLEVAVRQRDGIGPGAVAEPPYIASRPATGGR